MKRILFALYLFMPVLPIYAQAVDECQFSRYLFAYFVRSGDLQEYLRFAISRDAINWRALNGNRPVVASDTIAKTQGIHDPHVIRGEHGEFLMVCTDMWNWTKKPLSFTKDFYPCHGSVIPITLDEATRLVEAFPSQDVDSILYDGDWEEPEDPNGMLLVSYGFDQDSDDSGKYPVNLKGSAQFVWLEGQNRVLATGNDGGYLDLGKTWDLSFSRK